MKKTLFKSITCLFFCLIVSQNISAKEYTVTSPDKKITVQVNVDRTVSWSVRKLEELLIKPSSIGLTLNNNLHLGQNAVVQKASSRTVDEMLSSIIPSKNRVIPNHYNELHLKFRGNYSLVFRVYNDGAAYRFETDFPQMIEVKSETADLNLGGNYRVFWPQEKNPDFQSHYEAFYTDTAIADITDKQYGYLPLLFTTDKGTQLLVSEADLYDYPNLFFFGSGAETLTAAFPQVVLAATDRSDRAEILTQKAGYIAKTTGKRTFPWRTLVITDDKGLVETEMIYKLSSPNVLKSTSWIKPGKVAWDWWNANNIHGVDFKSGINTETYKYYVDFASEYGLEYIILDEGWSKSTTNLIEPNDDLDIEELIRYAAKKNVGVILWVLWKPLDKDLAGILDTYVKWGAKGIKVDFMQRADQGMVNYFERVSKVASDKNLLVDFHGAYKPAGLNRKYPNVISFEGVKGLENSKWSTNVTPKHDLIIPFSRMAVGPMDYTPGAMLNSTKENFRTVFSEPMSQGTRAHQAAMFVIYESPLQMLADNPSNYKKDPHYTRFISRIPTVWDQTVVLDAKVAEYLVTARRNGKQWYIGAMTDWTARTLTIPARFLGNQKYRIEILRDGINADRHASDYKIVGSEIDGDGKLHIEMSSGGGWAAILTPIE